MSKNEGESRADYAHRLIAQQQTRLDRVQRGIGTTVGSLMDAGEVLPETIANGLVIERTVVGNLAEREDGRGFFVREITANEEAGIPESFPVKVLRPGDVAAAQATCGTCGRSWDEAIPTQYTPTPSGRCPFEWYHDEPEDTEPERWEVTVMRAAEALTRALEAVPGHVVDYAVEQVRTPATVLAAQMRNRIEEPTTVPETGGRISEYLTDEGKWIKCTVLTENAAGLHSIELQSLPGLRDYAYDVTPDRIRWTS